MTQYWLCAAAMFFGLIICGVAENEQPPDGSEVVLRMPVSARQYRDPHHDAFRSEVPRDFVPAPTNAILELRTPTYLVWKAERGGNHAGYREIRLFVTSRPEEKPLGWCELFTLDSGLRVAGINSNGTILVSYQGRASRVPLSGICSPRYMLQPISWFGTNGPPVPTSTNAIFFGDSLDVPEFQVCYPRPAEIEGFLSATNGTNYSQMTLKVSAFVDGSTKSAECVVRPAYKAVKRIATRGVEKEMKNMFPILETKSDGVVFWDGTGWQKQNWVLPPARTQETNISIRL